MKYIFENEIVLFLIGVVVLIISVEDYRKNYKKKVSPAGKSGIIGFLGLGTILIIISIIYFAKNFS